MTKYTTSNLAAARKKSGSSKFTITGSRSRLALVLVGILSLGALVVYIVQINSMSTKGFQMRVLQNQIAALKAENEKLELQALDMQSMASLTARASKLNLVAASDVKYISGAEVAFAKR